MDSQQVADAARKNADEFSGILSYAIIQRLQLAYVARWLSQQDDSVLTRATQTAIGAITLLDTRP